MLRRSLGPSHYWQGAQASQPSVCSCDLSCTSWSGFCNGKIIKRGGEGRDGGSKRTPQGRGNSAKSPASLGPDLKVCSGSLKKGMHCPAPKRPEPPRAAPPPPPPPPTRQARKLQFGEGKGRQLGRKRFSPPNLLIHSVGESAVSECAFCTHTPKKKHPTDGAGVNNLLHAVTDACGLSALCQGVWGGLGQRAPPPL